MNITKQDLRRATSAPYSFMTCLLNQALIRHGKAASLSPQTLFKNREAANQLRIMFDASYRDYSQPSETWNKETFTTKERLLGKAMLEVILPIEA